MLRGSFHVHIIDADTGSTHYLEVLGSCENGGSHFGLAADDQAMKLGDDLDQLLFLEARFHHDLHNSPLGKGFDSAG